MSIARTAIAAAAVVVSGCAYFSPVVDTIRVGAPSATSPMPSLAKAVKDADDKAASIESKRDGVIWTGRTLDVATFGLGVGTAAAGLHVGHHINSVTNLTFAAGTTYIGSRLFAPVDVAILYNNGANALGCVVDKGATLEREITTAKTILARDDTARAPSSLITPDGCTRDTELSNALSEALTQKRALEAVVDHLTASDSNQADSVRGAANKIIAKLNEEVLNRSNNADALMSALKGLNVTAPTLVVPSDKVQAPAVAAGKAAPVACDARSTTLVRERADEYKSATARASAAANALAALDTACALTVTAITALALDTEEVTVTKDGRFNVNISGGREPYTVTAVGATSPNVDVSLVPPHTIVVIGRSTISGAGGPFVYQVKDNSAVATPKTLKVNTK